MKTFYRIGLDGFLQGGSGSVIPLGFSDDFTLLTKKEDGNCYDYYLPDMVNGMYVPDTVVINELALANQKIVSKSERQIACDDLVITITNGKQFNGDKKAIEDLKNAIETSREYAILYPNEAPLTETTWKLYDNTIQTVTFTELQEAYVRGNLQYQQTFISFG